MSPPQFVDTHVHLNNADLAADLPGVLERAVKAGVERFVVVGWDLASSERAVVLAGGDSRIFAVVGVHPHDAQHWDAATAVRLREWARNPRVIAIGEIGLDFYRDLSPRPAQEVAFRAQLALAAEIGLPVVIHCRDAYDETLAILESDAGREIPVILHCFLGTMAHAQRLWSRGWFVGVDGPITFKANEDLRAILRAAPRESLLLETDAPYLSPTPFRGRFPNEPSRLLPIAEKVAEVRGETLHVVADFTTANAHRAFPRLTPP
ncbi:MAG: TatD family hydrolase [Cytophagales bacterium]|nr:TatD family hydrolase [Armatimonadota bacterium]